MFQVALLTENGHLKGSKGREPFDVNIRAIHEMKGIGNGPAAPNDFWAMMNVSNCGLHHKTYKGHLKTMFKPTAEGVPPSIFTELLVLLRRSSVTWKSPYQET